MPIFLTSEEKADCSRYGTNPQKADLFWKLYNRAKACASRPGLMEMGDTSDWWYSCFDAVSNAAMFCALKPDAELLAYVRETTMAIVRRPAANWIGPWFRASSTPEPVAQLETAHLTWTVSAAYDLAPDAFTAEEKAEIETCLRERAIPMCRRFLDPAPYYPNHWFHNWHCIINGGLAVAAAVLNDTEQMAFAAQQYRDCCELFENDGSYGESLQYANYAEMGLFLTYEALTRRDPALAATFKPERYGRGVFWAVASTLYREPQEGWESQARPRAANFNDSAAIFQPTGDILLHVASRCKASAPKAAGLARWMFDQTYAGNYPDGPLDLASFGFDNATGFLTLPLLGQAAEPITPQDAGLERVAQFDCGDTLVRDAWDGRTVLAVHGGAETKNVQAHGHADLGSFILAHNHERLLADPGHSCYRGAVRQFEIQTKAHNAITFLVSGADGKQTELQQSVSGAHRARFKDGVPSAAIPGVSRKLLLAAEDGLTVVGYDYGPAYGDTVTTCSRFWILAGSHALFVIDLIDAKTPVQPVWNWTLNNHGNVMEYKPLPPDRVIIRRPGVGMKLFSMTGGSFSGPTYGFMHDSYHPLPGQRGEGRQGTAYHVRWTAAEAGTAFTGLHAIAVDHYGRVAGWHLKNESRTSAMLESPDKIPYTVKIEHPDRIVLEMAGAVRVLSFSAGGWSLA